MTYPEFLSGAAQGDPPPGDLSPQLASLWHAKAGNWERAHEIAQSIPTVIGSRIHGLLHAIEGDMGNSAYWFHRAGCPPIRRDQIEEEWTRLVEMLLPESEE